MPSYFPAIFGEKRNESLDVDAARSLFTQLTADINEYWSKQEQPKTMTVSTAHTPSPGNFPHGIGAALIARLTSVRVR